MNVRPLICLLFFLCCFRQFTWAQKAALKPRIVVLTDIAPLDVEPDDFESAIRLLVHADLFEIEGLVATTGWSDYGGKEYPDTLLRIIDAYEKDVPNLMKRSGQTAFLSDESKQSIGYWPGAAYLRSRTMTGSRNMGLKFLGEENRSAGSDFIIKMADEQDDRPLWILVWGGGNTVAQAIWQVQKERSPEALKKFLHKLRIYTITDQDRGQMRTPYNISSHYWMRTTFSKDLFFLWDESAWRYQNNAGKSKWDEYATHIQNHGNLGAIYPKYKWGVEGDTPSFLYVHPNGLNDPENPAGGGWGGFFTMTLTADSVTTSLSNQQGSPAASIARKYEDRFYPAIFNNFAARMDWAKDGKGNRNPSVIINKDNTLSSINLQPKEGSTLTLDASKTYDADGDKLTYSWWVLNEAGTYNGDVSLSDTAAQKITLTIPARSAGKNFHLICEVTDNGTPQLTAYRRIIIAPKNK